MGKASGFLEFDREGPIKRPVEVRKNDYNEVEESLPLDRVVQQASRCMDCGTPFCHSGCPLGNIIPEFNDAVYDQNWGYAYEILTSTNNFPEFTGRICPAPCEASCVLGINKPPVSIEHIEKNIIEYAFNNRLVIPKTPEKRTGKKVAIVGSGPAGLAAAAQLNKAGHAVTVFERADQIGGLLRYGIPDFKLNKSVIDRRLDIMREEDIKFVTNMNIGSDDYKTKNLLEDFDLIVLCGGSTVPRGLDKVKGWNEYLGKGIYPAMEFLSQQNKRVADIERTNDHRGMAYENGELLATDKNVWVIGGGDTGSDCVGTSNRHKAASITQVEVLEEPKIDDKKTPYFSKRDERTPWPNWPITKRTSTSHEEGCERYWSVDTQEFIGDGKKLTHIRAKLPEWNAQTQKFELVEKTFPCELALIAAGFLHPQKEGLLADLAEEGLQFDERGNVKTQFYQTDIPKVFAAGDMRRGQSLVVWAISEGREAARKADQWLMNGHSTLEAKAESMFATV